MQEFSASSRWPLKCKLIVGLCWICRSSYSEFTEGHRWRSKDPVTLSTTVLVRKTTSLLLCEPSHTHRCIAWTTQTWLIQGFLVNSKHYSEYIRKKLELIYNIVSLTFFSLLHYHYYILLPQFSRRNTSTFPSFSFSTLILCYDAKLNHRFPSLAHLKKGPAQEVSPHITVIQKENTHSHKAFSHTHTYAQLLCVERHVSAVFTGEKCFQFSNFEEKELVGCDPYRRKEKTHNAVAAAAKEGNISSQTNTGQQVWSLSVWEGWKQDWKFSGSVQ